MEIRLAQKEDMDALKEIWKLCFGDPEIYIDLYFQTRDWIRETAVLCIGNRAVSMLAMIPANLVDRNGERCSASMIFAVATHPEHRKLGYADRLLEFCNRHLASIHTTVTLLVPADEQLFRYYGKRGYRNGFFLREAVLSSIAIAKLKALPYLSGPPASGGLPGAEMKSVRIVPAEPSGFNEIRRKLLNGSSYLDYRDEEILFEKRTAAAFGTDIYTIHFQGPDKGLDAEGCFYAERASQETVIIKELLVPEEYLAEALNNISILLPAEEYIIRIPADRGEILGGVIRPFGMLRANRTDGGLAAFDSGVSPAAAYLGIAYD